MPKTRPTVPKPDYPVIVASQEAVLLLMEARSEIERLRSLNESLVNRLAGAVELLCRKANRVEPGKLKCPHCGNDYETIE